MAGAVALAAGAAAAEGERTILINFATGKGAGTASWGTWNETANGSGTYSSLKFSDGANGAGSVSYTSFGVYQKDRGQENKFMIGYLDDCVDERSRVEPVIKLAVPFQCCDVTIYAATDQNNQKFAYKKVNGKNYTFVDGQVTEFADGEKTESEAAWGSSAVLEPTEGSNAMTVRCYSPNITVTSGQATSNNNRGSIAALKIVEVVDGSSATISGTGNTWTTTSFAGTPYEGEVYHTANVDAEGASMAVDADVVTKGLTVNGGALTLTGEPVSVVDGGAVIVNSGAALDAGNGLKFPAGGAIVNAGGTFTPGAIEVTSGTLTADKSIVTAASKVTLGEGAFYDYGSTGNTITMGNLEGSGTVKVTSSATGHAVTINMTGSDNFTGTVDFGGYKLASKMTLKNISNLEFSGKAWLWNDTTSAVTINPNVLAKSNLELSHVVTFNKNLTVNGNITSGNSAGSASDIAMVGNNAVFTFTGASGTITASSTTKNCAGLYGKNATFNIGNGTSASLLATTRFENGDAQSGTSALNVKPNATFKITGSNNTFTGEGSYKLASLVIGEWNIGTTANIEGALLAKDANFYMGDAGGTINVSGTLAAKGVGLAIANKVGNGKCDLTLSDNGKLILGDTGISGTLKNSFPITFNAGTVGTYADATTIAKPVTLAAEKSVTFDTQKYAFASNGNTISRSEDGSEGAITVSGVISGEGSLVKTGAGTLTLSGANTYTGSTTVSEGTLALTGTHKVSGAIANSGTVSLASTVLFDLPDDSATTYTVISGEGTIEGWSSLNVSNFGRNGEPFSAAEWTADLTTPGVIVLSPSGSTYYWTGAVDGNWDYTTENWTKGGQPAAFTEGGTAVFPAGEEISNKSITLSQDITAGDVIVDASGATYTLKTSNKLSGGTLQVKAGTFEQGHHEDDSVSVDFDNIEVLSGATYRYNNGYSTLNKVTLKGGNFCVYDLTGEETIGEGGVSITALEVAANSTMHGAYANNDKLLPVAVGTLSGSGNLSVAQNMSGIPCEPYKLYVASMTGYTGMITVGAKITAELTNAEGESNNISLGAADAKIIKKGAGTIKAGEKITFAGKIQIDEGVFDANGMDNCPYGIILNGGTFANSSAITFNNIQTAGGIVLTADSTIDAEENFGVIASGYGATTCDMGGYTLTKKGAGAFCFSNTTFENGGKIVVEDGTLKLGFEDAKKDCTLGTTDIEVKAGKRLELNCSSLTGTSTVTLGAKDSIPGDHTFDKTGWAGTVVLPEWSQQINFNRWGTANSKVRVAGSDGCYFESGNMNFLPVVEFAGDFTVNNGYSGKTITFAEVTGAGNVNFTWNATGDNTPVTITKMNGYTGTLAASAKMATTIKALVWTDEVTEKVKVLSVDATNNNVTLESLVDAEGAALSVKLTQETDGWYAEPAGVAKIGDKYYETLAAAVADAADGDTVELLADATGDGINIAANKFATSGITIDFGGFTYTVGTAVGSSQTVTQGFRFLAGNKVELKNGTIALAEGQDKVKVVINNYAALTLTGMTIDGTNLAPADYGTTSDIPQWTTPTIQCVVGTVTMTGTTVIAPAAVEESTVIPGRKIENPLALMVANSSGASYTAGAKITVGADCTVTGKIGIYRGLTPEASFTTESYNFVVDKDAAIDAPEGYKWVVDETAGTKTLAKDEGGGIIDDLPGVIDAEDLPEDPTALNAAWAAYKAAQGITTPIAEEDQETIFNNFLLGNDKDGDATLYIDIAMNGATPVVTVKNEAGEVIVSNTEEAGEGEVQSPGVLKFACVDDVKTISEATPGELDTAKHFFKAFITLK